MATSTDERVTTDLVETLEDGRKGFAHAAERLDDSGRPDIGQRFEAFARQRREFSTELDSIAATYGDDIDEDGSAAAAIHRGWITVRDAVAGADPGGVLDAALTGEDHAISEYLDALERNVSTGLRDVIVRQLAAIQAVRAEIRALAEETD